ncbi:5,10-methenyltetrahydrofolate synthetase [Robbsia andropogonis]|uniref:5-formyltetrahydrofolate cyclo-ligase n=1 Tax=Robbsia andropogonis TaxID=28092 RepID=UPI003D2366D2
MPDDMTADTPSPTARGSAGPTRAETIHLEKQALRARLLPLRQQALSSNPETARAITAGVRAWLDEQRVHCVGFYWPLAGEPDVRAAVTDWLAADTDRRAALPEVVHAATALRYVAWTPETAMRKGRYGIAVPESGTEDASTNNMTPDALLIPCVGFDGRGFRLGYGGGYYDRTLASAACRPATLGVALDATRVVTLPTDAFDIPLDAIQTERQRYYR